MEALLKAEPFDAAGLGVPIEVTAVPLSLYKELHRWQGRRVGTQNPRLTDSEWAELSSKTDVGYPVHAQGGYAKPSAKADLPSSSQIMSALKRADKEAPLPPPNDAVPPTQRRALAAIAQACEKLLEGHGTQATVELQKTLEPLAAADSLLRRSSSWAPGGNGNIAMGAGSRIRGSAMRYKMLRETRS